MVLSLKNLSKFVIQSTVMKNILVCCSFFVLFYTQGQYLTITQPQYIKSNLKDKELAELITLITDEEGEDFIQKIEQFTSPTSWPECIQERDSVSKEIILKKGIVVGEWYRNNRFVVFEVNPDFDKNLEKECNSPGFEIFFIADRRISGVRGVDDEGNTIEIFDSVEQAYTNQLVFNEKIKINGKLVNNVNLRDFLDAENYPQSFVDNLKKYGNETNWPTGMKTPELRAKNRDEIAKYNAYPTMGLLTYKGEIYGIAWVPFSKNQHMPIDLRPTNKEGFFLIVDINYSSVESNNGVIIPKSHSKP